MRLSAWGVTHALQTPLFGKETPAGTQAGQGTGWRTGRRGGRGVPDGMVFAFVLFLKKLSIFRCFCT